MPDKQETYTYTTKCANCGFTQKDLAIPIGTRVFDYIRDLVCNHCGCLVNGSRPKE